MADDTGDLLGPQLLTKSSTTRLYTVGLGSGPNLGYVNEIKIAKIKKKKKGGRGGRRGGWSGLRRGRQEVLQCTFSRKKQEREGSFFHLMLQSNNKGGGGGPTEIRGKNFFCNNGGKKWLFPTTRTCPFRQIDPTTVRTDSGNARHCRGCPGNGRMLKK